MRRKDREMDREFGMEIIDKSRYGTLSIIGKENKPYSIPLSIVRNNDTLYFHSAKSGKKVDLLKDDSNVIVVFVGDINIPENYTKEELDEIAQNESKAKLLISNVFTTEFESAIVRGKVRLVEKEDERIQAMKLICEKYTPTKMEYFNVAIKSGLGRTNLYKINIDEITAKRKKYNEFKEEIKMNR